MTYNSVYGELPTAAKEGHSFLGWFTEKDNGKEVTSEMTFAIAGNQTLYAHWAINSYTVTFDFNNGTNVDVVFLFNETIEYPDNSVWDGYVFDGWSPKQERMPGEDITVRAQWSITKPVEFVEIVFGKKELSEEEAKEIIENFVQEGEEFVIEKFEVDKNTGEVIIVIKFTDEEKASEFVRNVNENRRPNDPIKVVREAIEYKSFSSTLGLFVIPYFMV